MATPEQPTVDIQWLPGQEDLPLPVYATEGAAGADIHAAVRQPLEMKPGARAVVPAGFKMSLPPGFEAQIRPRSGLALKSGLTLVNPPGTIDADYRGEVGVLMINLGREPVTIQRGQRIAQMVVAPVTRARFQVEEGLSETSRGSGGFGHTGL